jgi:hypothetical protein
LAYSDQPQVPVPLATDGASTQEGEWDLYSRGTEGSTDFVQTIDFTLSPSTIGKGNDIAIVADTISIVGQLQIPSKNVFLFARQITFDSGASIDSGGAAGVPYLTRALDGQFPGDSGRSGDQKAGDKPNQSAGGVGGNISLFAGAILGTVQLQANGGNGAKGQSGGNGQQGAQGPTGTAGSRTSGPGNGGPGRPGGQGGVGGIGGPGGNSGQITVLSLDSKLQVGTVSAVAGAAGDAGDSGKGGNGGIGGDPGNPCYFSPGRGGPHGSPGGQSCYTNHALQGPPGPNALPIPAQSGKPLQAATQAPIIKSTTPEILASWASISQLRMLLQCVELSFLNQDFSSLVDQLNWIVQLSAATAAGSDFSKMRSGWNNPGALRPTQDQEWTTVAGAARVLLLRYGAGLNAFGYAPQYVSQLSWAFVKTQTDQFIATATDVEKSYQHWLDNKSILVERQKAISDASIKLQSDITDLRQKAAKQSSLAQSIQDEIAPILTSLDHVQNELVNAEAAFDNVIRLSGGCPFLDMVKFVGGIIAIAAGVYAGAIAIVSAIGDVNKQNEDNQNFIDKIKVLAGTFENLGVAEDFSEMQQGYKDVLASEKAQNNKLVVSLESFEKQLEPYLSDPATVAYRDMLRTFVDLAETRNDKQVAYTQATIQSKTATSQADKMEIELAQASTTLAQSTNPALEDELQFLSGYLQTSKLWIMEMIDLKRRALMYQTLMSTPIAIDFRNIKVIDLSVAAGKLDQEWVSTLQTMNSAGYANPFQAVFTLDLAGKIDFKTPLTQKGEIVFTIPTDYSTFNRAGTSFVSLTEVALDLTGISSKTKRFTAQLEQQGSSTFVNSDGRFMNFLHAPRLVNLDYNFTNGAWVTGEQGTANNLGQSDSYYILLSPFSTWRLKIASDTEVDWTTVAHLNFKFKGTLIPRKSTTSQQMFADHIQRLGRLNNSSKR